MTVLAAAKLVQEMFEQVPEEAEEKMMALVNLLRVACTTTDADGSAVGVWGTSVFSRHSWMSLLRSGIVRVLREPFVYSQ